MLPGILVVAGGMVVVAGGMVVVAGGKVVVTGFFVVIGCVVTWTVVVGFSVGLCVVVT